MIESMDAMEAITQGAPGNTGESQSHTVRYVGLDNLVLNKGQAAKLFSSKEFQRLLVTIKSTRDFTPEGQGRKGMMLAQRTALTEAFSNLEKAAEPFRTAEDRPQGTSKAIKAES